MLDLFHASFGDLAFTRRRFVSLLDEAVQHNDSPTNKGAKEYARDPFGTLQSKLKQSFTEGFGVRLSEVGAEHNHTAGQHDRPSSEGIGQVEDVSLNGLAVVSDRVIHCSMLTIMLFACKPDYRSRGT